jgi:hypothetical protein
MVVSRSATVTTGTASVPADRADRAKIGDNEQAMTSFELSLTQVEKGTA